jgi:hypothetical protein
MRGALFSLFSPFCFLPVAQQPIRALAASFVRLLGHTIIHTHIPATAPSKVAEAASYTTQTQETNIHIINGIRTRNLSSQADSDLRLRLHEHQYSLLSLTVRVKFTRPLKQCP